MKENKSDNQLKGYVYLAIGLMVIWGIIGLFKGEGFFGGIAMSFEAIGELVALFLKLLVGAGILWVIFKFFEKKEQKKNNK